MNSAKETECVLPLRKRIVKEVPLEIPGFALAAKQSPVVQYAFEARPSSQWYEEVRQSILNRIGKGYFPIFRYSDGECYFSLGYRLPPTQPGHNVIWHYTRTILSAYVKYRCMWSFWSGQPGYGHEHYVGQQWRELRQQFSRQLSAISRQGMIAGCFCRHHVPSLFDRYIPDIYDWLDENGICLDATNYIPFYFIYAMLLGPGRQHFYAGRKLLVITSLTDEKQERLRLCLTEMGASQVNFISISRSCGMTDRIELTSDHNGTDVVLIGAGVGAANILSQLQPLKALSIDAGFVLDCYQDPAYKGKRVFTLPDEELHMA